MTHRGRQFFLVNWWKKALAKDNRWGHRDATMVLLAFRHGLKASELVDLRWEQVDLENAILHVR
jgi:type 1 fimbriae regulatory protein FimB/type 1 fimbriae regulatory protein FimE